MKVADEAAAENEFTDKAHKAESDAAAREAKLAEEAAAAKETSLKAKKAENDAASAAEVKEKAAAKERNKSDSNFNFEFTEEDALREQMVQESVEMYKQMKEAKLQG